MKAISVQRKRESSRDRETGRDREAGQAIVILAFAMIVLLAFAALAIDGGNAYVERRRAQNGADAGALAGARQIWMNTAAGDSQSGAVRAAMNAAAEQNGIADSNGILGDGTNSNVKAYYTDKQGNLLSVSGNPVEVGLSDIPPGAAGLKVYASREFQTFIAGIIGQPRMGAVADATAVFIPPVGCGDYAIYATGPSGNNMSVSVTGSSAGGGGNNFAITDGGIYGGDGGHVQNTQIVGSGLTVDIVGGCNGSCSLGGTATVNYNAQPQAVPALYDLSDYQAPSGQYYTFASGNGDYYYHDSSETFDGNMNEGVHFIDGNVTLRDIGGPNNLQHVSIIATGDIKIVGGAYINTYDPRMPALFSLSGNTSNGAVGAHNPEIEIHGFIYAPNGSVNISGASGALYGAVYAKEVKWDASQAGIVYEPAFCPPQRARVWLLK